MFRAVVFICLALICFLAAGQKTYERAAGERLLEQAQALLDSALYDAALQRGQAAFDKFPPDDTSAARCLLLLGNVFAEKGLLDAAFEQYQRAQAILSLTTGEQHLLTASVVNAQGECFYKKNDYARAEQHYHRALRVRETLLGPWHESVAGCYNNLGNCAAARGDYVAATALHEKSLAIRQKSLPADHPDLATSFNNLANCDYLSGAYGSALARFEKALVIRKRAFGPDHPKTAQVLNNMGNACAALGRRSAAIEYYRMALDIRMRYYGKDHAAVASALENIGDLCFDNGDYTAALDYYRQAYAIQQAANGAQSVAAASLWHKIGLCFQNENDFQRALAHHESALDILAPAFGPKHPYVAGLYNNIGNCFAGKKDFGRSIGYYERALHIFKDTKPLAPANIALVYNNLGTAHLNLNEAAQALRDYRNALAALDSDPEAAAAEKAVYLKNSGLALERLGRWPEARAAFETAIGTAADPVTAAEVSAAWSTLLCSRSLRSADTALLRQSMDACTQALRRADSLRLLLSTPAATQRWIESQLPVISGGVEACFRLWTLTGAPELPERALALAERNKSLQLLEQLRKEQAERFAGIPDSLLRLERALGEDLNRLDKQRLAWLMAGEPEKARETEAGISAARQNLDALIRMFETRFPEYFRLKYVRPAASAAEIRRQMLGPGKALLEYFVTDSAVFVFVLSPDLFRFQRLALDFPLVGWVAELRNSLQAYPDAAGPKAAALERDFVDVACRLYEKTVAPVAADLPEQLIVAPDGALAYLPFECLLTQRPADPHFFKTHAYLIRRHRLSYVHSAEQQLVLLQKPAEHPAKSLLAVAPAYENNPYGLRPLQNNRAEAQAVCRLFEGRLLDAEAATRSAFLQEAGQYRILLLATHGQSSSTVGDLSYLAFNAADSASGPFLYARDLYSQSIPADLVVLSACETSLGEYRPGQGVISLAKGFFHAGARSVVATLWRVDDARHAALMQAFFQQIKAGQTKDAALQKAKLDFLQERPHDEAHPVYWAGVTAYGDMRAIENEGRAWLWAIFGIAVLAVLAGLGRRFFSK